MICYNSRQFTCNPRPRKKILFPNRNICCGCSENTEISSHVYNLRFMKGLNKSGISQDVAFCLSRYIKENIPQKRFDTRTSCSFVNSKLNQISVTYNLQQTTVSNFAAFSKITNKA